MRSINWESVFDEIHSQPGATDDDIAGLVKVLSQPLSQTEIDQVRTKHLHLGRLLEESCAKLGVPVPRVFPWGDCSNWQIPRGNLPESYLHFLRWSNGGAFRKGSKWLDPVFRTDEVRGYLLSYDLPEHMPGALPFAFDGGGTFYLFDMREAPLDGEYPVLVAHASNLGFGASHTVGASLLQACQADVDPLSMR
jgi:hypothetical protein